MWLGDSSLRKRSRASADSTAVAMDRLVGVSSAQQGVRQAGRNASWQTGSWDAVSNAPHQRWVFNDDDGLVGASSSQQGVRQAGHNASWQTGSWDTVSNAPYQRWLLNDDSAASRILTASTSSRPAASSQTLASPPVPKCVTATGPRVLNCGDMPSHLPAAPSHSEASKGHVVLSAPADRDFAGWLIGHRAEAIHALQDDTGCAIHLSRDMSTIEISGAPAAVERATHLVRKRVDVFLTPCETVELPATTAFRGFFLGKQCSNIVSIKQQTSTRLVLNDDAHTMDIRGEPDDVARAAKIVRESIEEFEVVASAAARGVQLSNPKQRLATQALALRDPTQAALAAASARHQIEKSHAVRQTVGQAEEVMRTQLAAAEKHFVF